MEAVLDPITQEHIRRASKNLADEFAGIFSEETIERFMGESLSSMSHARVSDFVPVLGYRFARERLRALAQAEGKMTKEVPEVLFVCVHNAGRSQMAASLLQLRGEGRVHVRSAGSAPGEEINPAVVEAMAEIGVDLSDEFPKPLTDEVVRCGGCGHHDGLWRRVPHLPGEALPGLGASRPCGEERRRSTGDPRRNRHPGAGAPRRAPRSEVI